MCCAGRFEFTCEPAEYQLSDTSFYIPPPPPPSSPKDASHICDLICGKKLQCGQHTCQEKCHKGHCDKCWEYSEFFLRLSCAGRTSFNCEVFGLLLGFDELRCDCGAEVIYPPIPCGNPPPLCPRPCSRVHPCNHPGESLVHPARSCSQVFLISKAKYLCFA